MCVEGGASCGPYATLWEFRKLLGFVGELCEANIYAQAQYWRAIGPDLEVHFRIKILELGFEHPKAP